MTRVCILLVNWNGWRDTVECLESIMRLEDADFRTIVCDNDSGDGSLDHIIAWADGAQQFAQPTGSPLHHVAKEPCVKPVDWLLYDRDEAEKGGTSSADPQLVLIRTGSNLGFAGGNNVGLRYALKRGGFDYFWLLNNDTVVEPQALSAMLARMEEDNMIGICGSTLLRYRSPHKIQARGGGYYCKWIGLPWHLGQLGTDCDSVDEQSVERWMNYVVGASMLVSRQFLEYVGLLAEDYFLFFEETDWIRRAAGRYRLAYASSSRVYHKIGRSIGTSSDPRRKSMRCDYYAIRNRLLFTRRYFPEALPTIYLSVVAALLLRLVVGRWDSVAGIWRALRGDGLPDQSRREGA